MKRNRTGMVRINGGGGHRSERPEPDMNKIRRTGSVIEKNTIQYM